MYPYQYCICIVLLTNIHVHKYDQILLFSNILFENDFILKINQIFSFSFERLPVQLTRRAYEALDTFDHTLVSMCAIWKQTLRCGASAIIASHSFFVLVSELSELGLPEYVGVAEPVHQLHLAQHVGLVASQRVHLQRHHLASDAVLHLERQVYTD